MIPLSTGLSYIDLHFLDVPRIISTAVLHGKGGVALVDPGPSSTLPALRKAMTESGIAMSDVRALLLTHIHLDHAGSTGTLVRENPSLDVYVHERGAPHMVEPDKLIASATRLWGPDMDRLWGEVRPVPRDNLRVLAGGERISAGGADLDVLYTPGHASHHVSYFNEAAGVAFVGDTAGIRLRENSFVLPPTPPPDIDLEAWRASLGVIGAWGAGTLFVTHFGPHAHVAPHLSEMADHLELVGDLAKRSLALPGEEHGDEDRELWFTNQLRVILRRGLADPDAHDYEVAGRFDLNWRGLARYWRKRA
jgi:glyoxylase-like metal-dependent hydrolase (beta-lactamase superfamily II)